MNLLQVRQRLNSRSLGFSIVESIVAIGAGALLIGGAAASMKQLKSAMGHSSNLASLRSHAVTGLRLLRAEVQRSQHLMVRGGTHAAGLSHTDLDNAIYQGIKNTCKSLQTPGGAFNPLFAAKIQDQHDVLVVYGLGVARNGQNYSLLRCGEVLNAKGHYTKGSLAMTPILENIGLITCQAQQCKETRDARKYAGSLAQRVKGVNTRLTRDNETPIGQQRDPAFGIRTDQQRRVLELIDPTNANDHIDESYLQTAGRRDGRVNLKLLAYARSHPISRSNPDYGKGPCFYGICDDGGNGGGGLGAYQGLMFIVDVSGSMRGSRLSKLKTELKKTINDLPDGASLSLSTFHSSTRCYENCKLFSINTQSRQKLLRFVDTLRAGGGTRPWNALDRAMADQDGRTIFFMTDGVPNSWNGCPSYSGTCIASQYTAKNQSRKEKIKFNTIAVGRNQSWMQQVSSQNGGTYKQI